MAKKKRKLRKLTSYDLHALLDYLVVECACSNRSMGKRIRIPYKNVIEPDPQYANAELVVEIKVWWDAKNERTEAEIAAEPSPSKARH